jgi:hypothetical protein
MEPSKNEETGSPKLDDSSPTKPKVDEIQENISVKTSTSPTDTVLF